MEKFQNGLRTISHTVLDSPDSGDSEYQIILTSI